MSLFKEKLRNFFKSAQGLSDELFEDLIDLLVEGDFGPAEAYKLAETLKTNCRKERVNDGEGARELLCKLLEDILLMAKPYPIELNPGKLTIFLILGINGVGKTTTAAKLAGYYRNNEKRKPILAAADTFRAAAIDQLKIHGERLGVRVVAHKQGGDPAAVIYDALEAAGAGGGDLVIADTAGRMHTKSALVEELRKIHRVVESKTGGPAGCDYVKYLVLDATTGRNAHAQAEIFNEAVSPNGVILTKYDSSAKGGGVFSIAHDFKLPVSFLCTGEKYGDISPFDPKIYTREFVGLA